MKQADLFGCLGMKGSESLAVREREIERKRELRVFGEKESG